jgi:hypothetical protein
MTLMRVCMSNKINIFQYIVWKFQFSWCDVRTFLNSHKNCRKLSDNSIVMKFTIFKAARGNMAIILNALTPCWLSLGQYTLDLNNSWSRFVSWWGMNFWPIHVTVPIMRNLSKYWFLILLKKISNCWVIHVQTKCHTFNI